MSRRAWMMGICAAVFAVAALFWFASTRRAPTVVYPSEHLADTCDKPAESCDSPGLSDEARVQCAAWEIAADLEQTQALVHQLDAQIRGESLTGRQIQRRLMQIMRRNPHLVELGYARAPVTEATDRRLHSGVARRTREGLAWVPVQQDYAPEAHASLPSWYAQIVDHGTGWIGSRCDASTDLSAVRYAVRESGDVVYADVSAAFLAKRLDRVETGEEGVTFLSGPHHRILHHTSWQCVFGSTQCRSSSALPESHTGTPEVVQTAETIEGCGIPRHGMVEVCSLGDGDDAWTVGAARHDSTGVDIRRRRAFTGLLGIAAALLVIVVVRVRVAARELDDEAEHDAAQDMGSIDLVLPTGAPPHWKVASRGVTQIGLFVLLSTLFVSYNLPPEPAEPFRFLKHQRDVDRFVDGWVEQTVRERETLPILVPTGVYLQAVAFQGPREVLLTGIVWQRYPLGLSEEIDRGFLLPEGADTEITQLYDRVVDGEQVLGWSFKVVVNQEFSYASYPFGEENIWLQLWHEDFYDNVLLVPDLGAYKDTRPSRRPGLGPNLDISGWEVDRAQFAYREMSYDTSFGTASFQDLTEFPELHYSVIVRSRIWQPMVAYVLPVVVILVLLYFILILSSRKKDHAERWGFNAMNVVGAGSGFFLVAVFAHADLRNQLALRGLNYLETYYFATYIAILAVVANALALSMTHHPLLRQYDNGIPKQTFLPLGTVGMAALTLAWFW